MPSCASRFKASRIGELLSPYAFERLSTLSRLPGGSSQRMMDVFIRAKATSISGAPFEAGVESMGVG
jgi:hypothetical protein